MFTYVSKCLVLPCSHDQDGLRRGISCFKPTSLLGENHHFFNASSAAAAVLSMAENQEKRQGVAGRRNPSRASLNLEGFHRLRHDNRLQENDTPSSHQRTRHRQLAPCKTRSKPQKVSKIVAETQYNFTMWVHRQSSVNMCFLAAGPDPPVPTATSAPSDENRSTLAFTASHPSSTLSWAL